MKALGTSKLKRSMLRALAALVLIPVIGFTLAAYAEPGFVFSLANRWFLCF